MNEKKASYDEKANQMKDNIKNRREKPLFYKEDIICKKPRFDKKA